MRYNSDFTFDLVFNYIRSNNNNNNNNNINNNNNSTNISVLMEDEHSSAVESLGARMRVERRTDRKVVQPLIIMNK